MATTTDIEAHELNATIRAQLRWEQGRQRRRDVLGRTAAAVANALHTTGRAITALAPLAWLGAAGLAGALLTEADRITRTGDPTAGRVLAALGAILAGLAVKAAFTETLTARRATRQAARRTDRTDDLRAANEALKTRNRALWARAEHWQQLYRQANHDLNVAMRHTPFADELADIRRLRDTRQEDRT